MQQAVKLEVASRNRSGTDDQERYERQEANSVKAAIEAGAPVPETSFRDISRASLNL